MKLTEEKQMNATDELSPMMKIFTWRGDHAATLSPESPAPAATDVMPIITEATPSAASFVEISLAGAVVHFAPGTDPALLTDVLHAVRNSASMPTRSRLTLA
jgi:hypothetical protein